MKKIPIIFILLSVKLATARPTIITDTDFNIEICNYSSMNLNLQYANGYGVTVNNIIANKDLQNKLPPYLLKVNQCITPATITSTSFNPVKGSKLDTPGSITFNLIDLVNNTVISSFALSSLKSGIAHVDTNFKSSKLFYKYAYLTNVITSADLTIYANYYDEIYDPNKNFVTNELVTVINQGDGGYMQNLGGNIDYKFTICDRELKCYNR